MEIYILTVARLNLNYDFKRLTSSEQMYDYTVCVCTVQYSMALATLTKLAKNSHSKPKLTIKDVTRHPKPVKNLFKYDNLIQIRC